MGKKLITFIQIVLCLVFVFGISRLKWYWLSGDCLTGYETCKNKRDAYLRDGKKGLADFLMKLDIETETRFVDLFDRDQNYIKEFKDSYPYKDYITVFEERGKEGLLQYIMEKGKPQWEEGIAREVWHKDDEQIKKELDKDVEFYADQRRSQLIIYKSPLIITIFVSLLVGLQVIKIFFIRPKIKEQFKQEGTIERK